MVYFYRRRSQISLVVSADTILARKRRGSVVAKEEAKAKEVRIRRANAYREMIERGQTLFEDSGFNDAT